MRTAPYAYAKRFQFYGLVELEYRDYSMESSSYGHKSETGWTSFEQLYRLGLRGYVYNPKLVTFSTSVTFRKEKTDYDSGSEWTAKDINYDLSASFLPTRPVFLDVYALKTDSTIEGRGIAPYDISSNFYGAILCYASRKYPSIRLEYNHWDYTIERERVEQKTDMNRFSVNINGFLEAVNTRYNITGYLSDYSSPLIKYDGKEVRITTYTTITKEDLLSMYFHHTDIDFIKLTRFATNLRLKPIGRLYHNYGYEYLTNETEREKTDSHSISNYLRYRFSRMIFGMANLRYRFGKRDGVREESYDINTGLYYGKTIKDFDFTSSYKFALTKEERYGDYKFMGHSLDIGLSTRKFKVGKVYANYVIELRKYDFTYSPREDDFEDDFYDEFEESYLVPTKTDSLEHRVRSGINGKGPGRAYWNIEAEIRFFDSDIKDHRTGFWIGDEQLAEEIRHYTLTGDIGYRFGRRGLTTFRASYTTGETNSEHVERYYYEGRVNYRILRNLSLLAWWMEEWRNKGWWAATPTVDSRRREFGWKTREYQVKLSYLLRRITVSLEYNGYRLEEGPFSTEYKRLYLKLSRPFR